MNSSSPSIFCAQCLSKLDHLSNPPVLGPSDIITFDVQNASNLPLSPNEITQIDTFLVDASESLTEYDNAIAEIEGLLISLKRSRDILQRRCDSARYLISAPIRRLPLDVLHEIFTLFCEMDVPNSARYGASGVYTLYIAGKTFCPTLKLTWVCSFWRTFVQSCSKFWSSISVDAAIFQYSPDSFQILVKYISHSASSLLDFNLSFGYGDSGPIVQEAVELLWDCSTRWRRVIFSGDPCVDTLIINSSESRTQLRSFPALEYLEFDVRDWSRQDSFFRCLSSCPRLRVVKLPCFPWWGHNAHFSCVTSLTLDWFVGKSFGYLLRQLPMLESLEIREFALSEDDVDDGWSECYTSSLTKLIVPYSALQPEAWCSTRLPHLTDLTLILSKEFAMEDLMSLSSLLHNSHCQLKYLRIQDDFNIQSPQAVFDFIASQNYLTHLAIFTRHINPFVKFLKSKEDGPYVIRNLRSLELSSFVTRNGFEALACSICDLIESRCTVLYSANGNPEISGLQVLTVDLKWDDDDSPPSLPSFVHNRLSLLKEAGFKLAERSLE